MLGLSANLNYYLFNGNVDLRKVFSALSLCCQLGLANEEKAGLRK